MKKIRVRFAPSPTGPLHLGGVRTALYNYLFAKKHNGDFILRIEDTDANRFVEGAEKYIKESLEWCGIKIDEGDDIGGNYGPYKQSKRKDIYKKFADLLIDKGHAYYAFDTPEELEQMRDRVKKSGGKTWQYNSITRGSMKNSLTLPREDVENRLKNNDQYVIRIKLNRDEDIKFLDEIRGWVSVNTNNMDDKILFKGDGMPTYHLANVVDDHLMEITHVIRGEEWLPSAPLHVVLYKYFGWEAPSLSHLPLILKPDANGKLSKRDGDRLGFSVFPIDWIDPDTKEKYSGYREQGFMPDAFINMLALLGWNPGTPQEIFSMEELIDSFSLDRVGKTGAKFDFEKTKWFNHKYIVNTDNEVLAEKLNPLIEEKKIDIPKDKLIKICGIMKERATFIPDILQEGRYLFERPDYKSIEISEKHKKNLHFMPELKELLEGCDIFTSDKLNLIFKKFLEDRGLAFSGAGPIFRLCITGVSTGPSLFEICEILEKREVIDRMDIAIREFS
ncbi:glutamate--tRNA ligase [Ichthyobacterium seriolicida]|uniref:Glutamate--tRNA ligase n=1 Tax=Ichthyobacterium seriolicida TaxID=242600 RepID=A0A1J1E9K6_9FLAO|nr:glutamate--tRNA ligase [Ichthyobacterium seriolicida]BAV94587.1 glutamyl-tRNA synthetase [Ichthyobacterium seriolicida]